MGQTSGESIRHWWIKELNNLEMIGGENSGHNFPRHFHSGFSIGIIEDGQRYYSYGGSKHLAPAGSIVVFSPGEPHSCGAVDHCSYRAFCPDDFCLARWLTEGGEMSKGFRFIKQDIFDQEIFTLLRNLFDLLKQPGSALEKQSSYTTAMAELLDRYGEKTPSQVRIGNESRVVAKTREYIDDNYSSNISLEDLSNQAGFSPCHLLRVFTRQVGLPPHVYQTQVRIKQARGLLARGDTLAEVAVAAGFADQAHFTRCFKKYMGVTPGRYQGMLVGQLY